MLTGMAVELVRRMRRFRFKVGAFGSSVSFKDSFVIGPGGRVERGCEVTFGERVNVGADVTIQTDLTVGDDVMISSRVAFIGNDHDFSNPRLTIQQQPRLPRARIVVEGDNLLGFDVTILGNVTIGAGAIVGAGSLVTRDVPRNSICVGRPARTIGVRRQA